MIYLRTGANGAGKTLLTLKEVREKSLAESRPVYYNGRFDMVADFGWTKIEAKDWESTPDGSIFLFDECHNDFPVRSGKEPAPEYVRNLAEHRRRGFDFFLITQHPLNIDAFVRRLIGAPGWHQHLKRVSGAPLVSVLEWSSVNQQCEKVGAGESGSVHMVPFPREVYDWYRSTSLDTAKLRVPFRVWLFLVCIIGVPLLVWGAVASFKNAQASSASRLGASRSASGAVSLPSQAGGVSGLAGAKSAPQTAAEYVASMVPRLEGFAFTASRYDAQTQPQTAPYPAACIESKKGCNCFSQQATRLTVPLDVCRQIVAQGFFMDWAQQSSPVASLRPGGPSLPFVAPSSPLSPHGPPSPASGPAVASTAPIYFPPIDAPTPTDDADAVYMGRQLAAMRRGDNRAP